MSARFKLPEYCLHRPTGRAYVRLRGKFHYLGEFGSPESKARHKELVEAWQLREDPTKPVEMPLGA